MPMPNNGNGTPHVPELTAERETKLFRAIELGMPIERACQLVGISTDTFYAIKNAAEKAQGGKLKAWYEGLMRARAEGELHHLERVYKGGKGTAGSLWILERSYGYWRTERREEQHAHSGSVEIVVKRQEVSEDDRRE